MKKKSVLFWGLVLFTSVMFGQGVAINETGNPAHSSAMLDVSSVEGGILIPRMPYLQRIEITDPATGLLVYQTNGATGFYVYNGSTWEQIWAGTISIDDLSDGDIKGNSVYLGPLAGANDDGTNNFNVGVGTQASNHNIIGYFNVALGYQSLYNDTSSWNTAIGYQAYYNNSDGERNTGLGFRASYSNTTGKNNTILGYNANLYNQTGGNNTIVGYQAGFGSNGQSKSGNVFLGYQAGYNETGDNKLYIENSSTSSPLIYGEFDNDLLRVNGTLHIGNAYHFPLSDGTSGQVLATDGSGTVGWSTVTTGGGPTAINDLTDAKTGGNSVFLGADAGTGDDGSDNRNIALGVAALNAGTTGNYNSAFGYRASYHNTSGNYNIINGSYADYRNQGGSQNIIIGHQAGYSSLDHSKSGNIRIGYQAGFGDTTDYKLYIENSSSSTPLIWGDFDADSVRINGDLVVTGDLSGNIGIDDLHDGIATSSSVFLGEAAGSNDDGTDNKNTAVGYHALDLSTGEGNIAIGNKAGENNVSGNYNITIGSQTNGNNTGGIKNVMIGHASGYRASAHSKTGNIFIGYAAGFNALTDNKLYIENSSSSSPLIWGDFIADSVMINGDFGITGSWVGIGLDDLYDGRATSHSVFLGNGAGKNENGGLYNKNVAVGDSALASITYGEECTALGFRALYSNRSSNNTAIGTGAMESNDYGVENTAIGSMALHSNTSGGSNTALGFRALEDNLNGYSNTAIGRMSLTNNSTGDGNTALGAETMSQNSTGNYNTAVGLYAMLYNTTGNDNTAVGNYCLTYNSTGYHNTAVGDSALISSTTGNSNTAVGAHALQENDEGGWNTGIGKDALNNNTDGGSNTALGYQALYLNEGGHSNTSSGCRSLYNNGNADENTAIGYEALYSNVSGWRNTSIGYRSLWGTTGSYNTGLGHQAGPIEGSGSVENTIAIGEGTYTTASNYVYVGNTSQTWIGGQVTWSTYSDERMKDHVREDVKGLDFILKLRPVTYHVNKDKIDNIFGIKDDKDYSKKYDIEKIKQSGFLAQEVEQASVESGYDFSGIRAPANENTPYSISYSEFVVPLVKAIQEQQEVIEELKAEIELLKRERVSKAN